MNGRAYYNDNDRFAADWLERLIARGHIPAGDVDRRSIVDVRPADLVGYSQIHFFAGVGGWPLALRYAGWPDTWPIATGSCPCQPVSGAGKRLGHADERHLWPAFYGLIDECGFPIVFGEQVASADGREWFAAVRADLEGLGYAVGAADLCAAGVGAPHIRQRIYWVADADGERAGDDIEALRSRQSQPSRDNRIRVLADDASAGRRSQPQRPAAADWRAAPESRRLRDAQLVGDSADARFQGQQEGPRDLRRPQRPTAERAGEDARALADTEGLDRRLPARPDGRGDPEPQRRGEAGWSRAPDNPWRAPDWLFCRDGKWRPVEPGTFPLAHGVPGRVGRLRAYGNPINPYLGAEFIQAYLETKGVIING